MRIASLFRRTPFRLTVLFLALFTTAAASVLTYVYLASAHEARVQAEQAVDAKLQALRAIYASRGVAGLNQALIERATGGDDGLFLLRSASGERVTGNLEASPIEGLPDGEASTSFTLTEANDAGRLVKITAWGREVRLSGGERLFVGEDMASGQAFLARLSEGLWGAAALVFLLGLSGGLILSRQVERGMAALNTAVEAVRAGDLNARIPLRKSGDELDELAQGLNLMLDRLQQSMANLRHVGDAIAHDLRTPLTRLRARLESALIEVEAGRGDPVQALSTALSETDSLLKTFNTVLAIARLQAARETPDKTVFDAAELAADMAELYEPAAEDKGLEFAAEVEKGLMIQGDRAFLAQALANILDNAIKYTPAGGAVMLRARRRSTGEVEFSATDTGPGVPRDERARVLQRFVRLENSRSEPGSGLGLSLVQAVAEAHGGTIRLDEGPGAFGGYGPGLRVAILLPPA
ncbi:ATP-binding protein [Brevundimonas sp. 2R-24]|uniref:histidine kinase n=1 Tax=Peiella sedimenti TaxID=3061083 RepID=A0ABT8SHT9_9CAUL|nr:ATP-binding protein [Caulobacteraceae bacterium XZ-24]